MLLSVFTKDIWDRRKAMIWWVIGTVLMTAWLSAMYPVIRDSDAMTDFLTEFPPELLAMFGMDPNTFLTGAGFLQAQMFSLIAPIILISFAIIVGTGATAREEATGSMDMLLSLPVSRTSLILQKAGSMVLLADLIVLSIAGTLIVANPVFDMGLTIEGIAAVCLGLWMLAIGFGAVAILIGAFTGSPSSAGGVAGGLALVLWFVDAFSELYDWLEPLAKLSPFRWYLWNLPLLNGLNSGHLWLALFALAVFTGATVVFSRRNIGTSRAILPRRSKSSASRVVKPRAVRLLQSVFGKTMWDRRRTVWYWAFGLSAMSLFTFAAWPALSEDAAALEGLMEAFPKEVLALFGLTDPESMTTPEGMVSSRTYISVGPIAMIVFAITAMTGFVAREESSGRLDLVLSTTQTRRSVLYEKAMGTAALIGVIVTVLFVVAVLGNNQWGTEIDFYHIVSANIGLGLLGLCFWGIAIALWALFGSSGPAIGVTAAVAVVTYFLNGLGSIVDFLAPFRYLSPFYWYLGDTVPLAKGLTWGYLVMAWVAIAGTSIALKRFETRDLAV